MEQENDFYSKKCRRLISLSGRDVFRIVKMMSDKLVPKFVVCSICCAVLMNNPLVDAKDERTPKSNEDKVEEVLILGERFEIDTTVAFARLTESNSRGAKLYKQGKYKEALPYLLAGAKTGFKMSQARVGAIYLGGLGGVKKDLRKGIGWLGVASEPITAPEIRNTWKRVFSGVSESSKGEVAKIVSEYVALYGRRTTGTECEMTSNTKSLVAQLECTLDDEFYRFASDEQKVLVECFAGVSGVCGTVDLNHLEPIDTTVGGESPF